MTEELARVEEEFQIIHKLGVDGKPFDLKSAMMNVQTLLLAHEQRVMEEIAQMVEGETCAADCDCFSCPMLNRMASRIRTWPIRKGAGVV